MMNRRDGRLRNAVILILTGAVLLCACSEEKAEISVHDEAVSETASASADTGKVSVREETLGCNYFDQRNFDLCVSRAESYETEGEILCATVPHHLTAGHMAAGLLKSAAASRSETETVVIVSTLHYPAKAPVITSPLNWSTPFGMLETDKCITDRFISDIGACEDSSIMELDHSSSALIPFVKYYFPEAKAACLLVGSSADRNASEDISRLLTDISREKKCLFLFSVDFSHYLEPDDTDRHDSETRKAVISGDLDAINRMTDANVDSYRCLGSFVRLCGSLDCEVCELDHSNNLLISELAYDKVTFSEGLTSYFIFAGTEKKTE